MKEPADEQKERELEYHLTEVLKNEEKVLKSDLSCLDNLRLHDFYVAIDADSRDEDSSGAVVKCHNTTMAKAIAKGVRKWYKNGGGLVGFLGPGKIHLSVLCKSGRQIVVPMILWKEMAEAIIKKND